MAEKEYIERGAVLAVLRGYSLETGTTLGRHSGAVDAAMADVERLPVADAASVVHGEWEMGESGAIYFCSRCNYFAIPRESREWHFCPNCGAMMDGGKK